jgi:hypothetical protein
VSSNGSDNNSGGGYGVYVDADPEPYPGWGEYADNPDFRGLVLEDGTAITEHELAGVYLGAPGSYISTDCELSGAGTGKASAGIWWHGDAVVATGGVQPWDTLSETGLLLQHNTLKDAGGAGLFLDGATATLSGNSWSNNSVDIVQQSCEGDLASPVGMSTEMLNSQDICPEYDYVLFHDQYTILLNEPVVEY